MRKLAAIAAAIAIGCASVSATSQHVAAQDAGQVVRSQLEKELRDVQALDRFQNYWRVSLRDPGDAFAEISRAQPGTDVKGAWGKAVDGVFQGSAVAEALARRQLDHVGADVARAVIAFRRTELGRKVTEAEVTSPFPENKIGDQKFVMGELQKASRALEKDKARRQVLGELLAAAGGVELQAELLMALSRGFAIGMALAAPQGGPRPSIEEISAFVDKDRSKMMALVKTIALPSLALSYSKLSMAELRAYVAFLKTPAGAQNIAGLIKAVAQTMGESSTEIGRQFGRNINAQRT